MTEIGVFGTGRDNEMVERNAAALADHLSAKKIDSRHLSQEHLDIALVAKNASDR
jgi:hypothetical protein